MKPRVCRRKKIIKIRAEINETQSKKEIDNIYETKSWFFEMVNKTNKPLARLTNEKGGKALINKTRNERREIIDITEIQRSIK